MLNTSEIAERKFSEETQRAIGEVQLHHYGTFLERHNEKIRNFRSSLRGRVNVGIEAKPVTVQITPREDAALLELVHSDNKLLGRILVSLASMCNEVNSLVNEARNEFYDHLIYYGEVDEGAANYGELSALFELLQRVDLFVTRSQHVINLILRQLCAIVSNGLCTSSFSEPLDCLAELIVCLITLDLLLNSGAIKEHWMIYRKAVRAMSHNPAHYNIKRDSIRALDKKLAELESLLLSGNIFQNTIDKCLDEHVLVSIKNTGLINDMLLFIQHLLAELERDDEGLTFNEIWMQANAMFVLYFNLHGNVEKKLMRRLIEINKKISVCSVSGNVLWYPEQFLAKHLSTLSKFIDTKSIVGQRAVQVTHCTQNLQKESNALAMQACRWIMEAERTATDDMSRYKIKQLQDAGNLLVDGVKLVKRISDLVRWITNLHADEARPMPKSVLLALCKLVEILKCFQFVFQRHVLPLSYVIVLISQHLTHKALALLSNIKKSFKQDKRYKEQQLDVLFSLVEAERALRGPNTKERLLLAKLALSASGLPSETLASVRSVLNKIELISNVVQLFDRLSNCSFLYWHQILFPIYFSKIVETKTDLSKSYLLLAALSDCTYMGKNVKSNVERYLKINLLEPLNQSVEGNLRLQTHLHLQLTPLNPFQTPLPRSFRKIFPVLFDDTFVNVKQEVEHYLSTMFYNLTTVVLHDWKTYGEMRRLAALQYGLHTVEDSLPVQTLEQGLDVLEIMRNINVFVSKYLYNLNCQVFVEESSNSKHLNTINISHVANSIRTHGIGIMSTTVNFTYQFLQNKFYIMSQFMFDELIKSRLLKDVRYFAEQRAELNQLYPYSRADKFNFSIRKLGLNENGHSYLDLFRKLITQIGNAMGYVRLVRSGGKRCVADATCFIPDLKGVAELNKLIDEAELSELTRQAANSLKRDINNLVDNFEEATEYFKLLINAFVPTLRNPQNIHLRNFYMIVPPLTINFVEHMLSSKESLFKKNRMGSFTDDGFAMGLAYVTELLDQGSQLNSLHWFQSVRAKHGADFKTLDAQKSQASKEDVKLQQTLTLTEKRIKSVEQEFQLFYYNFSSARIFFQN